MTPTIEPTVAFSPVGDTAPEQKFAIGKVVRVLPVPVPQPLRATLTFEHQSILPGRIRFAQLHHPKLKVKKGFVVDLRRENDSVVAVAEDFAEFGYGASLAEALHDLAITVAELFFSLSDPNVQLSPDLASVRQRLHDHIAVV
jgi:hypothetical protein